MLQILPRNLGGRSVSTVLLLLGFVTLSGSIAILFYSIRGARIHIEQFERAQLERVSAEQAQSSVEGIQIKNEREVCISKQEYLSAIERYLPSLIVEMGNESTRIDASKFSPCLSYNESKTSARDCPVYSAEFNWQCLDDVLRRNVKEKVVVDTISGVGGKAVVNSSDWLIDYNLLATSVIEQYSGALHFTTIMSAQNSSSLVIQAPKSNMFPGTDGSFASRYIEVDGSRQMLFLWEGGVYEKFRMSGAYPQWNPVGVYRILEKSPLSWSSTASKWMPYWMPFTYDTYQDAALGIHALVYWYPGLEKTGSKKLYESESNIGTPKSTGCMRLTNDDAKYVYERTRVGDPVVIHD